MKRSVADLIKEMFADTVILLCRDCHHEWQDVGSECGEVLVCHWCGSESVENLSNE